MPGDAFARYRPEYREAELRLICQHARTGESLCFVGIAGIGKSNLVNFLRSETPWRAQHLGDRAGCACFPLVNSREWEGTPQSLWRMMLRALVEVTTNVPTADDLSVLPLAESDRHYARLQVRLQTVCQRLQRPVTFVMDDFDNVIESGPLLMLEGLNGLREDRNRGWLSYLIFTKRLPHVLGWKHDLQHKSKFYDLWRRDIYALEPYIPKDAHQMLMFLNAHSNKALGKRELAHIHGIVGGHAQLLKVVHDLWSKEGPPPQDALTYFADKPDVREECLRVLQGLHEEEQEAALRIVRGQAVDSDILNYLNIRGLVQNMNPVRWFSPLMARFLSTFAPRGG
jgi:hypothetical protein